MRPNALSIGHEVLAITNSPEKQQDAKAMGADDVLVVKDYVGKELTEIGGVDAMLSFSPSMKQNSQAIEGLRPGGRLVTTAVSAEPIQGDPIQMLFKQTSIVGSAHNNPADLVDILGLTAVGKVKPQLEIYPLDEINRVLARLAEGKVRHRAVLTHN